MNRAKMAFLILLLAAVVQGLCAAPVSVSYLTWAGGGQREADERAVAAFNAAHPDIQVTAEFVDYNNFDSKINTLVAAGSPPDVSFLQEYNVNEWGAKGTIEDLTAYFKAEGSKLDPKAFVPGALFKSNGKIWGATPGIEVILLYFNKDLFQKAGVALPSQDPMKPWTWAQFVAAAKKLTVDATGKHPDDAGFDVNAVKTYGTTAPSFWLFTMPFLYSNNGSYASADGKKSALSTPQSVEVIQSIADLMLKNKVAPTPTMQKGLPSEVQALINGQLAMFISGTWNMSAFAEEKYFTYGMAPIPMFKKPSNISWGSGVVIYAKSKSKKQAWEFVKSYIDPQAGIQLSIDGSWMPNQKAWYTDKDKLAKWTANERHNQDFLKVVPRIATDVAQVPENVSLRSFGAIVNDMVQPALDKVWVGDATAEKVIKGEIDPKIASLFIGAWKE
jgi:multiple sugar transport system substrate-binding protein